LAELSLQGRTDIPGFIQSFTGSHRHVVDYLVQEVLEPLSERELEVLQLLAAGRSNQEIAEALVVAVGTVKTHIHHIYGKLNANSRVQAVARARELQLLS